ncbi:hypothetical protein SCUCBS95973_002850 [Sporothrix curviconia]|uniref:Enoyl reductase (ER) domain-containing protein n=1 Tax=Sporothrix curviconia TaxID=1260050 RepID=A0ABP0BAG0_9PEZI
MADMSNPPADPLPATMRAWVYHTATGGIDKTMKLVPDYPIPEHFRTMPSPPAGKGYAVIVRILATSMNPADHKVAEMPILGRFMQKTPATPCIDFCGRVVRVKPSPLSSSSSSSSSMVPMLKPGQLVAGMLPPYTQHGALAEYALAYSEHIAPVPEGVSVEQAAMLGIGGSTAWNGFMPQIEAARQRNKKTDGGEQLRLFINGGSGGIGSFIVPMAKAMGCHVTASCSGANAGLVRDVLGADDVIDYRTTDVATALISRATEAGRPYDMAIDAVGMPFALYKAADKFLARGAAFSRIGFDLALLLDILAITYRPALLGGGTHPSPFVLGGATTENMSGLMALIAQGKLHVPLDGGAVVPFEEAPRAIARIKSHRTQGKIVARVAEDRRGRM